VRFAAIEGAIASSRQLLRLPKNWDDEGAQRISDATREKAVTVLRLAARVAYQRYAFVLPAPRLSPCHDGSIDIFFKTDRFTLLINIPAKPGTSDFYAEKDGVEVKGPLNLDDPVLDFLYFLGQ